MVLGAEGIAPNRKASVLTELRIVPEKEGFTSTDIIGEYDGVDKIANEETVWYEG